ncbi:MAG: GntR family transcriptional regulator [Lachnospiraceae bacterium]|nr:GntR family transcriptional regulator [Lachnospiraceae bacterium]
MIIALNHSSEIPIYMQIRNQIVLGISDGRLVPGEQLPTVRALADEIGINAMTVSKAYQILKQDGYIYADRRNGARVRDTFEQQSGLSQNHKDLLKQIISEAKISGLSREAFLIECEALFEED